MNTHRDEPAAKKDLDQVKQELIAKIDTNGKKIDQVEQKLTHRIDQVEQSLSAKIDSNSAKIDEVERRLTAKIDANSAKIDANGAKIDANGAKIDANGAKIDANTASIGRLTAQVTKNGEAIKETLTREEHKKDYNELLRGQDEMMVVLLRIDQEELQQMRGSIA